MREAITHPMVTLQMTAGRVDLAGQDTDGTTIDRHVALSKADLRYDPLSGRPYLRIDTDEKQQVDEGRSLAFIDQKGSRGTDPGPAVRRAQMIDTPEQHGRFAIFSTRGDGVDHALLMIADDRPQPDSFKLTITSGPVEVP
jgi:hypothetical protein